MLHQIFKIGVLYSIAYSEPRTVNVNYERANPRIWRAAGAGTFTVDVHSSWSGSMAYIRTCYSFLLTQGDRFMSSPLINMTISYTKLSFVNKELSGAKHCSADTMQQLLIT